MTSLYSHAQLDRVLNPRSVAVIGASDRAGSFGQRTLQNLKGYTGTVYPINAKYAEIDGRTCYASVRALPQPPDCVIVAIPRDGVVAAVEECIEAAAGGVVIYTSGFGETGRPEHAALQQRLAALARASGMPVIGPNCLGLFNAGRGLSATFATTSQLTPAQDPTPRIGLVSQSGAMGISLMQSVESGVRFSHLLTAGNSCDVDVADLLGYLAADPQCQVVACLLEGMAAPRKLLAAGRIARQHGKPVLIYKFATGSEGAAAAMSHTGSLAGSNEAYDALFDQAGFIRVDSLEGLVEAAAFFAKAPRARAEGIGVLTGSGGAAILVADRAEHHGVALPQLAPPGQAVLEEEVPEFGAARNPCDLTAQAMNSPHSFPRCAEAFLNDEAIGAVLVCHNTAGFGMERMPVLSELSRRGGKPICIVWLSQWLEGPGTADIERDPHLALFRSTDRCVKTVAQWLEWSRRQAADTAEAPDAATSNEVAAPVRALLAQAEGATLSEGQSREALAGYGVPFVRQAIATDAEAAVRAATAIGYPVVLKIESPDIPHKSDAGGVRLNLQDAAAVAAAYQAIVANARAYAPRARIAGVSVQAMAAQGVEILLGAKVDPLMGPLVTVGLGGVLVEVLRDHASALCPVSPRQARAMLARLRSQSLLRGYRGAAAVDLDALSAIVAAVSRFAHDHQQQVAEVDINPLICGSAGIVAVDALIVKPARTSS